MNTGQASPDPTDPGVRTLELLDKLTIVTDESARLGWMTTWRTLDGPRILAFLNAHAINLAWRDPGFHRSLMMVDWLMRDGIGLKIGLAMLGRPPGCNLNGTDLIPILLQDYAGCRIGLMGTESPYLDRAAERIRAMGGVVVGSHHGFDRTEVYVELARAWQPEMLLLAMGMPKQEVVAMALREALTQPVLIVNGGAILDFLSDRHPRAPLWMRRTGLEWLYRFLREPVRLARRYVMGNPLFLARIAWLALRRGRIKGVRGGLSPPAG